MLSAMQCSSIARYRFFIITCFAFVGFSGFAQGIGGVLYASAGLFQVFH